MDRLPSRAVYGTPRAIKVGRDQLLTFQIVQLGTHWHHAQVQTQEDRREAQALRQGEHTPQDQEGVALLQLRIRRGDTQDCRGSIEKVPQQS